MTTVLAFRVFFVIGPMLAVWAVVVSVIGFTRPDWPDRQSGQRIAIAITALLVIGVIASSVIGAKFEKPEQVKTGPENQGHRGEN
ncbi:MAG TPA: hypothetical protein VF545_06490 [Thermoleophilaceae bacterium]